ncbi:uncharacterized protein LOC116143885 [Pistacia vera]|uniref:uncharacterized protein LOC116143885 n=1 Tax=Pistacia vera TaxID=55513 RepID=UPI001263D818|nr:uncharacterized protein LOC116143885 [Pistacia vera]
MNESEQQASEVMQETAQNLSTWSLYVDGSSNRKKVETCLLFFSLEGARIHGILQFSFKATNNEAEYETLLAGLRLAKEMGATAISIHSDSMLIVNQILGEYQAKEENMISYLKKAKAALELFKHFTITQIPRDSNFVVDALARIASSLDSDTLESIPVRFIETFSISPIEQPMNVTKSDS